MKKVIALALAGAMIFSTPVMAKEVGAPVAQYNEAEPTGEYPSSLVMGAIAKDKTIPEYAGNAVIDIWAMDEVQDLALGQGVVIDGEMASGVSFDLLKPSLSRVYDAKAFSQGKGSLLNVVKIHTYVGYGTAQIKFYAPGVKAGQAITVYQYVSDGNWVACPTTVADDHITVDITSNGHFALIEAK